MYSLLSGFFHFIIILRFIQVLECTDGSLPLFLSNIPLHRYTRVYSSIQLLKDLVASKFKHLSVKHLWTSVCRVLCGLKFSVFSMSKLYQSMIVESYGKNMPTFVRKLQVSSEMAVPLCIPTSIIWESFQNSLSAFGIVRMWILAILVGI